MRSKFFLGVLYLMFAFHLHGEAYRQVEVIVFDFFGVIASIDNSSVRKFVSDSLSVSKKEIKSVLSALKPFMDRGGDQKVFWKNYAASKGKILSEKWFDQLEKVQMKALREKPGIIAIVQDLQKQGYQVALLSDVAELRADAVRKRGYYDLFDPVLLSYQTGCLKPSKKAYQILLEELNRSPSSCLFIDDRLKNVKGAQELGIDGIQFTSSRQLKEELKKRGILS